MAFSMVFMLGIAAAVIAHVVAVHDMAENHRKLHIAY